MAVRSSRICLGVIVGAKGIKGEVRIKSFTEDPAGIGSYGPVGTEDGSQSWALTVQGAAKGVVIARLKGVVDRAQAEALKGVKLYVDRAQLPEAEDGSYYHADLIGLDVVLTTGEAKGQVVAVHNFGAGDIIEVGQNDHETTMVPFSEAAIAEVNMKDGLIRVVPLPGVFDDGEEMDQDERQGDANDAGSVSGRE